MLEAFLLYCDAIHLHVFTIIKITLAKSRIYLDNQAKHIDVTNLYLIFFFVNSNNSIFVISILHTKIYT